MVALVTDTLSAGCSRQAWNEARPALRWCSRRAGEEPESLTADQKAKLARVAKANPRLPPGSLLEEGLRSVFAVKGPAGEDSPDRWLGWAQHCRIPEPEQSGMYEWTYQPWRDLEATA